MILLYGLCCNHCSTEYCFPLDEILLHTGWDDEIMSPPPPMAVCKAVQTKLSVIMALYNWMYRDRRVGHTPVTTGVLFANVIASLTNCRRKGTVCSQHNVRSAFPLSRLRAWAWAWWTVYKWTAFKNHTRRIASQPETRTLEINFFKSFVLICLNSFVAWRKCWFSYQLRLMNCRGVGTTAWKWGAVADLSGPVKGNKEMGLDLWPEGQESLILPHLAVFADTPAFY